MAEHTVETMSVELATIEPEIEADAEVMESSSSNGLLAKASVEFWKPRSIIIDDAEFRNPGSTITDDDEFTVEDPLRQFENTKDLSLKAFLRDVVGSLLNLPQREFVFLLGICCTILFGPHANIPPTLFDFLVGGTTNTLLSFGKAFDDYFITIIYFTMANISYIVTSILVFQVRRPGVKMLLLMPLMFIPFHFLVLMRKASASASGVDVACGGLFQLPLIWFIALGVLGLSVICVPAAFFAVYWSWRYMIVKGKSGGGNDIEAEFDSDDIEAVDVLIE